MKQIIFFLTMTAGAWFAWHYVMKARERSITRKWGLRTAKSLLVATVAILLMFAVLSLTSWRLF